MKIRFIDCLGNARKILYPDLKFGAIIQEFLGSPVVTLLFQEKNQNIYIGIQDDSNLSKLKYTVFPLSQDELREYVRNTTTLQNICNLKKSYIVERVNNENLIREGSLLDNDTLEDFDYFIDELCPSIQSIEKFLKVSTNKEPEKVKRHHPVNSTQIYQVPKKDNLFVPPISIAKEPKEEYKKTK